MMAALFSPTGQLFAQKEEEPAVLPYCDVPVTSYTKTLPNGWKASESIIGTSFTGEKILVVAGATVYFDRNITMNAYTVRLENNARIIVADGENGATLTASGTVFFGCTDMWDAIEIGKNSTFILTGTEIRNARRGLVPLFGNKSSYLQANPCKIQGCTFRDNGVGITLDFTAQGGSTIYTPGTTFYPSVFAGNTFTTSNRPKLGNFLHPGFAHRPVHLYGTHLFWPCADRQGHYSALTFNFFTRCSPLGNCHEVSSFSYIYHDQIYCSAVMPSP